MTHVTDPIVNISGLSKSFKGIPALRSVSLTVRPGEMLALVGASGSGKSTLLRNINGLQVADSGVVKVFGSVVQSGGSLSPQIRTLRSQIGFVFQQFNLVGRLTALDNVLAGHLAQVSLLRSLVRAFSREEKERALSALEKVGIVEQAYKRASFLSGGQQQRVAIARCLMQGAQIILADEPVASLDPESARQVMQLLTDLNREQGITVITSLHQVQVVRRFFLRTVALKQGEVQFDGITQELTDQRLNTIYGAAAEELVHSGHAELVEAIESGSYIEDLQRLVKDPDRPS